VGSKILTKSKQEPLSKFEREAKSNKYKGGQISSGKQNPIKIRAGREVLSKLEREAKSCQNWMGSNIMTKSEQEFLSKFRREAKSNKYKQEAKSYQNSIGTKILSKSDQEVMKIGAGIKILIKIKWEATSWQNPSRSSYKKSSGKENPINTSGEQNPFKIRMGSKIRAGSPLKIWAGSIILSKIKWEAKS
jgi:hypothetical protein